MASVAIIHAQEDALPARALAEKLRQAGLTPIIEQAGKDGFRQALREAAVVMALWSPRSVGQDDLIDDAQFAHNAGPVLHVCMQNATNPAPFAADGSIDLTGWRGQDDFPTWREVLKAVARRAGLPEPALPQRAAASPFFQPGQAAGAPRPAPAQAAAGPVSLGMGGNVAPMPPRPRQTPASLAAEALSEERLAPIRPLSQVSQSDYARRTDFQPIEPRSSSGNGGSGKLALIGGITFLVVAGLGLGGYLAWDRFNAAQSADAAWTAIDTRDPSDLQRFLEAHGGSSHDAEARRLLEALDGSSYQRAQTADTIEAYQRYLSEFPEGENALSARGRIAELRAMPSAPTGLNPTIDPATGLPIDPNAPPVDNPDLAPPGMGDLGGPPVESTEGGGPVPLAPPPTNAPATAPPESPAPSGAPL